MGLLQALSQLIDDKPKPKQAQSQKTKSALSPEDLNTLKGYLVGMHMALGFNTADDWDDDDIVDFETAMPFLKQVYEYTEQQCRRNHHRNYMKYYGKQAKTRKTDIDRSDIDPNTTKEPITPYDLIPSNPEKNFTPISDDCFKTDLPNPPIEV